MAWTTPRTWTDGELVTAAIMNPHIRDNMNTLTRCIGKTADQSIASSTTLTNDTHLFFAMGTNENWFVAGNLWHENASDTPDIKIAFTIPAGGDYHINMWNYDLTLSASPTLTNMRSVADVLLGGSTATGVMAEFRGVVQTAGTAGNFQLQWAQNTSNASATILKKGSAMWFQKII
jgi:hypothetical protein